MKAFLTRYANTWGTNSTTPLPSSAQEKEKEIPKVEARKAELARRNESQCVFDSTEAKRDTITRSRGSDVMQISMARAARSDPVQEAPFVIVGSDKDEQFTTAAPKVPQSDTRGVAHKYLPDGQELIVPERKQSIKASTRDKKLRCPSNTDTYTNGHEITPKQSNITSFSGSKGAGSLEVALLEKRPISAPESAEIGDRQSSSANTVQCLNESLSSQMAMMNDHAPNGRHLADKREAKALKASKNGKDVHQCPASWNIPSKMSGSQDLASELNNLAIAHNEGLLGEEEYRMLRQAAFQKKAAHGGMNIPREERFNTRASHSQPQPSSFEAISAASSPPASMRSRQSSRSNILSLFRKPSSKVQQTSADSAVKSKYEAWSSSSKSKCSQSAVLQAEALPARRARSIRSSASFSAKTNPMSSSDNSQILSLRKHTRGSSGVSESSGLSVNGLSASNGNALFADSYRGKSSAEIEAEIAVLEAESRRIIEGFRSLQLSTIGRYRLDFDELRKVMALTEDSSVEKANGNILTQEDHQQDQKSRRKSARKSKSFGALKAIIRPDQHEHDRRDALATSPPSSYRNWKLQSHHAQPMKPLRNISPNQNSQLFSKDDSDEMIKLRSELDDIIRRRNDVSKKYDDRLAFLQSTLRSAKIRETLK